MRTALVVGLLLVMAVFAVYQSATPPEEEASSGPPSHATPSGTATTEEKPAIGFRAPAFQLPTLEGQESAFPTGGRPAVINFWASWCGPCAREAPDLVKLYETYKNRVDFYAVNLTDTDDLEDVHTFVRAHGFSLPVLLDEKGSVANRYAVQAVPTTFYVNSDGIIVDVVLGVVPYAEMERRVKRALGE